jgi:hypothetical protein
VTGPLRDAIRRLDEHISAGAVAISAIERVEDELFQVFVANGMHVLNARQWAHIITKELQG